MKKAPYITIPKSIAREFAGFTGAIVGNKVVAGGLNTLEALANAKKKYPQVKESEIGIMTLPPKDGIWVL